MKMLKKILAVGAILVNCIFAAPKIWDGTADVSWYDSSAQTFSLTTAEQLAGLAKLVNEGISDFTGKTINLEADIFLNDTIDFNFREWHSIGSKGHLFKGEFNGGDGQKNYKIYGLLIEKEDTDDVGFFGRISGAKIHNLDILVGRVVARDNVGALVGYAFESSISNVHSDVGVIGNDYVGGLVGRGMSATSVENCSVVVGTKWYNMEHIADKYHDYYGVVGRVGGVTGKGNYIGGLVGYGGSISGSFVEGFVRGIKNYVGGLVGYATGEIDSSFHNGDVEGNAFVGGIVGYIKGGVIDSYSRGNIAGTGDNIGGLVGFSFGSTRAYSVSNSYTIGDVNGNNYVGGVVGRDSLLVSGGVKFKRSIVNSYSTGKIIGEGNYVGGVIGKGLLVSSSYHIEGDVVGNGYVGGVAGQIDSSVVRSYSEGNVLGNGDYVGGVVGFTPGRIDFLNHTNGNVKGNGYVGGVAGRANNSVAGSYSGGNVTGIGDYVGGVVGYTQGRIDSSFHIDGDVSGNGYVGGVAGKADSSVVNSYSEGNVAGLGDYVGGVIGRSLGRVDFSHHINGDINGGMYVGGVAGRIDSSISASYSIGNVVGKSYYVGGVVGIGKSLFKTYAIGLVRSDSGAVGGVAGTAQGSIDSSFHNGGDVSGVNHIGGLVGAAYGTITHSYSEGNVIGTGDYVGGLAGFVSVVAEKGLYFVNHIGNYILGQNRVGGLVGCVQQGNVSNSYAEIKQIYGSNYVGGLIGINGDGTIEYSQFNGDSLVGKDNVGGLIGEKVYGKIDRSHSEVSVKGNNNVGGLVGRVSSVSVVNSYATVNVFYDEGELSENIGGLIGFQKGGVINKAAAHGNVSGINNVGGLVGQTKGTNISQAYANGNVSGKKNTGGLVGSIDGSINESYANGNVVTTEGDNTNVGCLVGVVNDTANISNSYFDNTKCDANADGSDKAHLTGVFGKSTSDMQVQSTFDGWDFSKIWIIPAGSYPFVRICGVPLKDMIIETESLEGFKYDGTPKTPLIKKVMAFEEELQGYNYTVTYKNNVNAGTAFISVCGSYPYRGCSELSFEIAVDTIKPTIGLIDNIVYTGSVIIPKILVYNGDALLADSNYIVDITNNINVGTASVKVTMVKNYSGFVSTSFLIAKAEPVIIQEPQSNQIVIGDALENSSLIGGVANTEGVFVWKNPKIIPEAGTELYAAIFLPMDTANYTNSAEIMLPIRVLGKYNIVFKDYDGTVLKDSVYVEGTLPEKIETPNDPMKSSNIKYIYTFAGWTPMISEVTEDAVYTAIFDSTLRNYTVKFVNDSEVLQSTQFDYGTTPSYSGATPVKTASEKYTYSFKTWDPSIAPVMSTVTYRAVFDSTIRMYSVSFMNGDTKLQGMRVAYGEIPEYTKSVPTKKSTDLYSYEFVGWSPKIGPVEKDMEFFAVFDSTAKTGIADARFANLEMSVVAASRSIQISAAPVGTSYAIFDMQGRVLKQGRVDSSNFNIAMPIAGNYLVKVGDRTRRVSIK